MQTASGDEQDGLQPAHELLQAVIHEDSLTIQDILDDAKLSNTKVNWQDQLGWTSLIYAAFRGDFRLVKKLINRGATVNHMALSRAGSSADGTTPLHACAAMRRGARTTQEGFYETARVLMLAGGNPYQENLSGMTPIDVAANSSNTHMKVLLEGCALFKGTLTLPIAKLFGGKLADRYCIVLPRFAWHPLGSQNGLLMRDGNPSLSLVCYKAPEDLKPLAKIPLDGARVVVEGGMVVEEGYLIVKAPRKQLRGLGVKSSTSNSCVVEIRAKSSATQTAGQVLQSLAEVCKSAAVAAYCGNLGQLCEASMVEALHNLGLAEGLLPLPGFQPVEKQPALSAISESRPVAPEMIAEMKRVEEPPKGRKSLSLSRIGKAALRRLSIGDKPRRNSISMERQSSGERMGDLYPSTKARQQAAIQADFSRISEETPETEHPPVDWATVSRDLPPLPSSQSRRRSLQVDDLSAAKRKEGRLSLSNRYAEGREILVSNQGIPMDFWGGMRDQMMRRSVDGRRTSLSGRRPMMGSQVPSQPVNVRASYDIGDLDDVMNPLNSQQEPLSQRPSKSTAADRATDLLDARRPADSTMQDWVQQAAEQYDPNQYEQWKQPPDTLLSGADGTTQHKVTSVEQPTANRRITSTPRVDAEVMEATVDSSVAPATPPLTKGSRSLLEEEPVVKAELPPPSGPARRASRSGKAHGESSRRPVGVTTASDAAQITSSAPNFQVRPPPVVNLSSITRTPTHRSEKSRSSGKAPRPPSKNGYSSNDWFSPASGDDDLFHWSLRPEGRGKHAAPHPSPAPPKPKVDPAVARWAAEAAAMVKDDRDVNASELDEFAQAGWRESPGTTVRESPTPSPPKPAKQLPGEDHSNLHGSSKRNEAEEKVEVQEPDASKDLKALVEDARALQERNAARRANKNPSLHNSGPPPSQATKDALPSPNEKPRHSLSSTSSYFSEASDHRQIPEGKTVAQKPAVGGPAAADQTPRPAAVLDTDDSLEAFHSPLPELPTEVSGKELVA